MTDILILHVHNEHVILAYPIGINVHSRLYFMYWQMLMTYRYIVHPFSQYFDKHICHAPEQKLFSGVREALQRL